MIAAAPYLSDLILSVLALIGLATLHGVLTGRDPDGPLTRRFLFGVRVLVVLFAGRALAVVTGGAGFRFVMMIGASLVPLAALLLTEGLLRRHAPASIKSFVGLGTALFLILSVMGSGLVDPARLWGLIVFQLATFAMVGWMVWRRDRAGLSAAENTTVVRLSLSLLVLAPLAVADFAIIRADLPVQASPIGVLVLCWLAIGLGQGGIGHRTALRGLLVVLAAAGGAAVLIAFMAGMDRDGWIITLSLALSAALVGAVVNEARNLRVADRSASLLRHLAAGPDDPVAFLQGLQGDPMVDGAALIDAEQLAELDSGAVAALMRTRPVLRRADPPPVAADQAEIVAHLFARFDASHILLVGTAPLRLVALNLPSLASSPRAELELAAVQRMALLIGKGADAD
ncbi:hypothetical protein [Marivivens marinus]|uniref:hypothetical protein n=1 Tax=Marivivens marinus TaxID=3110173 RepID=UPI003B84839E